MEPKPVKFSEPPVIETVLSIQFAPVPGFTGAHAGCYWQSALASELSEWNNAKLIEAPKLPDEFEDLGPETSFGVMGFQIRPADGASRVQIVRSDDERMIQVQDSRFVYNWRKSRGPYPSFPVIKPEFDDLFDRFKKYLANAAFPTPQANQWEIHYINQIPKGTLWESVSDWARAFPGLYVPPGRPESSVQFETMASKWRYRFSEGRGRMHVSMQHGRTSDGAKIEVILLQLIARGPILDDKLTAEAGFSLGHMAIVDTFHEMTSGQAHCEWKEGGR